MLALQAGGQGLKNKKCNSLCSSELLKTKISNFCFFTPEGEGGGKEAKGAKDKFFYKKRSLH
jgi:hypothetical protein